MSRLFVLAIFMLWMSWQATRGGSDPAAPAHVPLFLGGLLALVMASGTLSLALARRVVRAGLDRSAGALNRLMLTSRGVVVVWYGVGLWAMGWGDAVDAAVAWIIPQALSDAALLLPGAALGTAPALLAFAGLIAAQHPAERAIREQSLLLLLDRDLPVHAPPSLRQALLAGVRLQILFTAAPVLLILLLRDAAAAALRLAAIDPGPEIEAALLLACAGVVYVLAPELLRRILRTSPLPDSELRDRLSAMFDRIGLRCRDILLWQTNGLMSNAAVMGIVPRWRYVLLSDLLVETLTDEQIEATFAHEAGHVAHRHMAWYLLLVVAYILASVLIEQALLVAAPGLMEDDRLGALSSVAGMAVFFALLGVVSRRFERQADLFAARATGSDGAGEPHIARALLRVAIVNNLPVHARDFFHGSIASRVDWLRDAGDDAQAVDRFDRAMGRLRWAILAVVLFGAGTLIGLFASA